MGQERVLLERHYPVEAMEAIHSLVEPEAVGPAAPLETPRLQTADRAGEVGAKAGAFLAAAEAPEATSRS